ncbi:MAG: N-acetylmuramoyl-L-alanine amidase [Clostridia bacterium]|nr:N-acetylmuramoyl-L-alanine amidase [Clostridia bacterium]
MKKIISVICILTILLSMCSCFNAFANDISLVIDNKKVACDVPPIISNDRTLVPVRALFEHLNAKVTWNEVLRQVIVTSEKQMMIFNIDSKIAYLNGAVYALDVAPTIINGRTLVPVRFVSENLGYKVDWDNSTRTVIIKSPAAATPPSTQTPSVEDTKPDTSLAKISGVTVSETETVYTITISMSAKVTPKVMTLAEPHRLIFDFYNVNMTCKDGKSKSYMSSIVETRWASHPEFTRIVVESLAKCEYTSSYSSGKYIIKITKPKMAENPNPDTSVTPTVPAGAPIVVLDAGHGGRDPGALGRDSNGNIILYEKNIGLNLAKKVKTLLTSQGVSVIMTRETDKSLGGTTMQDLLARCDIANDANASLFVSFHANAFTNTTASGTCVLYAGLATNSGYEISGKQLAQNIQTPLVKATGLQDRGIVARPNIVVLKETVMPAALIECAFITCPTDQQVLSNEVKLNQMAEAIAEGIIKSLRQMGRLK